MDRPSLLFHSICTSLLLDVNGHFFVGRIKIHRMYQNFFHFCFFAALQPAIEIIKQSAFEGNYDFQVLFAKKSRALKV